jgi:nitrogen-specific signal transduction histidine kinase/CheY-like chemotaxis protein
MCVLTDITEAKRLQHQFLQAQKMEAFGQVAGGIAHDFNNLLTAIIGYSELVLDRIPDQPDVAADIEEIKKAGERASQLTRQLLMFSRKQLLVPQVLGLNQVVSSFEKMLRRIISEDIRFEIVAMPSLGRTKADPGQIEQLLMNLVVNARDAMPQGGTLTIATANVVLDAEFIRNHAAAVPGRYVSLAVQDTGCGMTLDVLARVFEPFFTTKGPAKGTGLGLSTVYGLVQQSGGYLTVESTPGVGTTVTTYLPTVDDVVESAAGRPRSAQTLEGTETILLVEDEAGVRNLMRKILERYGYRVLHARDADQAIAIEDDYRGAIHLLVSDMIMPGLSGPDLAQRIVRRRPAIKVLFVSGYASREALDFGVSSQNARFLQKPFRPETLAEKVRERLDGDVGQPARTTTSL